MPIAPKEHQLSAKDAPSYGTGIGAAGFVWPVSVNWAENKGKQGANDQRRNRLVWEGRGLLDGSSFKVDFSDDRFYVP